jgi:protein-tyrosine phosphatase
VNIIVLCTANQCRSPMAAALLERALSARNVPASVSSAGFLAGGRPAAENARNALAARGLDLRAHCSRQVTAELLGAADLVIAMERRHVQQAALLNPACWPASFPLKDLVLRAERSGRAVEREGLADWVAGLHEGRRLADVAGGARDRDVADPMGGSPRAFRRTAEELEQLLDRLVDAAFPAVPGAVAAPSCAAGGAAVPPVGGASDGQRPLA